MGKKIKSVTTCSQSTTNIARKFYQNPTVNLTAGIEDQLQFRGSSKSLQIIL